MREAFGSRDSFVEEFEFVCATLGLSICTLMFAGGGIGGGDSASLFASLITNRPAFFLPTEDGSACSFEFTFISFYLFSFALIAGP